MCWRSISLSVAMPFFLSCSILPFSGSWDCRSLSGTAQQAANRTVGEIGEYKSIELSGHPGLVISL